MPNQIKITGVVLAGGLSSRMGQDKSEMLFREQKLIEYSINSLTPFCEEVLISSNNDKHASYNHPIVKDKHNNIGPIAGLYTALLNAKNDYILVLPCDSPLVDSDLIERLISNLDDKIDAVIPVYKDFKEPLFAIYHKSILPVLEMQIQKENFKLMRLIDLLNVNLVKFETNKSFANINAPKDFENLNNLAL